MEKLKGKLNLKIIIPIIVIIAIVGIVMFINKKTDGNKISEKDIIGTWEKEDKTWTIELYEGGTGKIGGYTLTWEIKEKVLNITANYASITKTTGYKVKNNTMTSLDGEDTYYKVK